MPEIVKAIILGVIQGITEFLPVSSSGHLVVGQNLMGFKNPEMLLDVSLHVGTLLVVLVVFWKDLVGIVLDLPGLPDVIRKRRSADGNIWLLILLLVGTFITAIIGFVGEQWFTKLFSSMRGVGISFLITGTILYSTKFVKIEVGKNIDRMSIRDALSIGAAQGIAITPGISRSGTTISAGLLLGLDRELAARFSFLLFIPAVVGATLLELKSWQSSSFSLAAILAGSVTAFAVGYLALRLLLNIVRRGAFYYFAFYCWLIGAFVLLYTM